MKTILATAAAACAVLIAVPAAAQVKQTREQILFYTSDWKGERFPDGRPKVPDALLKRAVDCTIEDVWGYLRGKGFRNQYEGGYRWRYQNVRNVSGRPDIFPDVPPGTPYFVEQRTFITGAAVKVEQEAQFIEDRWQVTDRWMAYLGLRNEQFKNINGAGDVYVKQRHQLAPRLGVTWDVFGDSTFKVYANAGRYHLAIPSNVAIRGASASLYSSQYFTYNGVGANGEPLNLVPAGSKI